MIKPFRINVSDDVLADLKARLQRTRWPDAELVNDWSQGAPLRWIQDICQYWANTYDWRAREARLNRFDQFISEIDGLGIHFLHVRSKDASALPLIITHGWPGSIVEFQRVIEPLVDPAAHGGDPADAFHVVCPSLPGFGFSAKPKTTGWGVERIATTWAILMDHLGYARYGAQGGDWGSLVTTSLGAQDDKHCAGIHITLGSAPKVEGEPTAEEKRALANRKHYVDLDSGYSKQQSTRPQTLGYGLTDSPAGQAAWILRLASKGSTTGCRPGLREREPSFAQLHHVGGADHLVRPGGPRRTSTARCGRLHGKWPIQRRGRPCEVARSAESGSLPVR